MIWRTLSLAAPLLVLGACGGGISNGEILNKMDREMERRRLDNGLNAAAPATSTAGVSIDRAMLIGRWSDAPGCRDVITEFQDDGTFRVGPRRGTWALTGNRVTIGRGDGATSTLTVEGITDTEFFMTADTGERLRSYRCNARPR